MSDEGFERVASVDDLDEGTPMSVELGNVGIRRTLLDQCHTLGQPVECDQRHFAGLAGCIDTRNSPDSQTQNPMTEKRL